MSKVLVTESYLEDIADAIRDKLETEDTYTPAEMAGAIEQISGGSVLITKTITENGTYDAVDDEADGYSSVIINVAGGSGIPLLNEDEWEALSTAEKRSYGLVAIQETNSGYVRGSLVNGADYVPIDFYDWILFDSANMILPFTLNADYKITVVFNEMQYRNDEHIIGNTGSASYIHLTPYANKWFTSLGTGETSFTGDYAFTDKHTFVSNDNGHNTMDGDVVTNYTPYTGSQSYTIGNRGGSGNYKGRIYSYKIESISTGKTLLNLRPALINGQSVLYDTISRAVVPFNTGTGTVGNDQQTSIEIQKGTDTTITKTCEKDGVYVYLVGAWKSGSISESNLSLTLSNSADVLYEGYIVPTNSADKLFKVVIANQEIGDTCEFSTNGAGSHYWGSICYEGLTADSVISTLLHAAQDTSISDTTTGNNKTIAFTIGFGNTTNGSINANDVADYQTATGNPYITAAYILSGGATFNSTGNSFGACLNAAFKCV